MSRDNPRAGEHRSVPGSHTNYTLNTFLIALHRHTSFIALLYLKLRLCCYQQTVVDAQNVVYMYTTRYTLQQ